MNGIILNELTWLFLSILKDDFAMARLDMRIISLLGRVSAIGVFVLAAAALIVFSSGRSAHVDDSYGSWILKDWLAKGRHVDILVLGDSQLGGLRAADAEKAGRSLDFVLDHRGYELEAAFRQPTSVFISAQPGCLLSDYYAILRGLLDRSKDGAPRLVVLAVSPRVLLTNGLSCPGESEYYRFFAKTTDLNDAYVLAYPSIADRLLERIHERFGKPLSSVKQSQFVFLPDDAQVYQERELIPANFRVDQLSMEHQIRFLQKSVAFLRSKRIDCLVVLMPVKRGQSNRRYQLMSQELLSRLTSLSSSDKFWFISLDDNRLFQKEDFLDSIHLSQRGGQTFAKAIAHRLNRSALFAPR